MFKIALFITLLISLCASTTVTSYTYINQGADWNGTCIAGNEQSPINLPDSTTMGYTTSSVLIFNYTDLSNIALLHNGPQLYFASLNMGFIVAAFPGISGAYKYAARQVVFHAPSEHELNGKQYELEMQVIHEIESAPTSASGIVVPSTVIVSVLFTSENNIPSVILDDLNVESINASQSSNTNILVISATNSSTNTSINYTNSDFRDIMFGTWMGSIQADFMYYVGSLTIPTCDENVGWYVFTQAQDMSTAQINAINNLYENNAAFAGGKGNNRAIQSTNNRAVYLSNNRVGSAYGLILSNAMIAILVMLSFV